MKATVQGIPVDGILNSINSERWNITLSSFDHRHHNSLCIIVKLYIFLVDLDEEEEDGKVGGDGDSNVQLHCLHLDHQGQVCVIR